MAKEPTSKSINPTPIKQERVTFCVVGLTPLVYHAMSAKVMQELLLPKGRKTALDKQLNLKHDPYQEYRDSVYRRRPEDEGATTLVLPSRMFKDATAKVAKRVPGGGTTTEMKQLLMAPFENLDLFGVPQIFLCTVRNSDIARTPDVRSRAIVPEWCCRVTFDYVTPQINVKALQTLLAAAGTLNGVGDYRQEKGSGNYGCFKVVSEDDPDFLRISGSSRAAQDEALDEPLPYDHETKQLLNWYDEELLVRQKEAATPKKAKVKAQ